MVTVAIMGILAGIWARASTARQVKAKTQTDVISAYSLIGIPKVAVTQFYAYEGEFPRNNEEADLLSPTQLGGSHASSIEVVDGAIHITIGNNASKRMHGKVFSFRPSILTDAPYTPNLVWVCGNQEVLPGRVAMGENRTSLAREELPRQCRGSNSTAIQQ